MGNKPYLSLGDAIQAFLDKHGLKEEAEIQSIIQEWEKLMGKPIASNTEKIWFNRGTFYVKMKSPVWRNELQMARMKIRDMINARAKKKIVDQVKIV
jgi:predicted nucleic acid-binding Zn ribbon protein